MRLNRTAWLMCLCCLSSGVRADPNSELFSRSPIAAYQDWQVFVDGSGEDRKCWIAAQPASRSPAVLSANGVYFFITIRKNNNRQSQLATMLGFVAKRAAAQSTVGLDVAPSDPNLRVGSARYSLVTKDSNAWLRYSADEGRVVADMSAPNAKLTIKTVSTDGTPTSDEYELGGFTKALERARQECADAAAS